MLWSFLKGLKSVTLQPRTFLRVTHDSIALAKACLILVLLPQLLPKNSSYD